VVNAANRLKDSHEGRYMLMLRGSGPFVLMPDSVRRGGGLVAVTA
jgi:hypothetical protein